MNTIDIVMSPKWFDDKKHPALDLGFVTIPAYVIPATLALLLPLSIQLHRRAVEAGKQADLIEEPEIRGKELKGEKPQDLENDGTHKPVEDAKKENRFMQIARILIYIYHAQWTISLMTRLGSFEALFHFRDSMVQLCLCQAAMIMITWYLYHLSLSACLCTALGWSLYLVAYSQRALNVPIVILIVLLALPYTGQRVKRAGGTVTTPSGTFLLLQMLNILLPLDSLVRRATIGMFDLWPLPVVLVLQLGWRLYGQDGFVTERKAANPTQTSSVRSPSFTEEIQAYFSETWTCISGLVLGFGIPMSIVWVISSYSFTSLGWWWIIFNKEVEPPSVMGGAMAAMFHLGVFLYILLRGFRGRSKPGGRLGASQILPETMAAAAVAISLTSAIWLGLWMLGLGLKVVHGSFYDVPSCRCR